MTRRLADSPRVSCVAFGLWFLACSLESDLPVRTGSTAPVSSGVTLSGAATADDVDAAVGYGESSRISDIPGKSDSDQPATAGMPGGTDRGGAFDERAGDIGGAASTAGGAAGGGGRGSPAAGSAGSPESGGTAGASAKEPLPELWFSEYIEGSSSNKALEITAQARSVLDGCKVGTYFNGKTEATTVATLSGVLETGQVLTLCTSVLKERLAAACNQVGNLTFNGDDVVTLSCDGKILDVIGQIGVDPGEAWGGDTNSTVDHSLRRQCHVHSGDALGTDAFNPSTEWLAFPVDTFDGLGTRGC